MIVNHQQSVSSAENYNNNLHWHDVDVNFLYYFLLCSNIHLLGLCGDVLLHPTRRRRRFHLSDSAKIHNESHFSTNNTNYFCSIIMRLGIPPVANYESNGSCIIAEQYYSYSYVVVERCCSLRREEKGAFA